MRKILLISCAFILFIAIALVSIYNSYQGIYRIGIIIDADQVRKSLREEMYGVIFLDGNTSRDNGSYREFYTKYYSTINGKEVERGYKLFDRDSGKEVFSVDFLVAGENLEISINSGSSG